MLAGYGYTTVALEYSKGYGTTYPRPVEQANAALAFLVRNARELKIDPGFLVLAGDSAGAHIASQVALVTTDSTYAHAVGIPAQLDRRQIAAILLMSGVYDPTVMNFEGNFGWFLKTTLWAYSGIKNFRNDERFEMMSVTRHVTNAFPPAFISSGNGDPLEPQSRALARRLGDLGVRVDTLFFPPDRDPPLPHEYQFNLDDPAGPEALNRMLAFLSSVREPVAAGTEPR